MSGRAAFPGSLAMLQSAAWVGIYGLSFVTVLAASLPALLGDAVAAADAAGAAGRSGARRGAADPGAGGGRRAPARPAADPPDRDLAAPGAAVDPADAEMGPGGGRGQFPPPDRAQRRARRSTRSPRCSGRRRRRPSCSSATTRTATRSPRSRRRAATSSPARCAPTRRPAGRRRSGTASRRSTATGAIRASYDKAHLVPFGEYMPFGNVLPIDDDHPGRDRSQPPARDRGPWRCRGLPAFAPLDLLRGDLSRRASSTGRRGPAWMLNVTNDAWYGRSSGPVPAFRDRPHPRGRGRAAAGARRQ